LLLTYEIQKVNSTKNKHEDPRITEPKEIPHKNEVVYPPTKSMLEADENIKKMEDLIKKLKGGKT
jgi:hypothetical protein